MAWNLEAIPSWPGRGAHRVPATSDERRSAPTTARCPCTRSSRPRRCRRGASSTSGAGWCGGHHLTSSAGNTQCVSCDPAPRPASGRRAGERPRDYHKYSGERVPKPGGIAVSPLRRHQSSGAGDYANSASASREARHRGGRGRSVESLLARLTARVTSSSSWSGARVIALVTLAAGASAPAWAAGSTPAPGAGPVLFFLALEQGDAFVHGRRRRRCRARRGRRLLGDLRVTAVARAWWVCGWSAGGLRGSDRRAPGGVLDGGLGARARAGASPRALHAPGIS